MNNGKGSRPFQRIRFSGEVSHLILVASGQGVLFLGDNWPVQQLVVAVPWLSCVQLFVIPWTMACQAPLSMGFSRQEYWNGLPFPSPEELPNTGIEPWSPASQADSLPLSYREVLSSLNRTKHAYIFTYVHVYVCIQTYLCVFYIMLCFICLSVHIYSNTHMHGYMWASQVVNGKEPTTNAGDVRDLGSTPRSKICPGGQHAKILVF